MVFAHCPKSTHTGETLTESTPRKLWSSWDISNVMTFTSQIYSYILLPTICKIISSLSAVMDEEKYFFLTKNRYRLSVVLLGHRFELGGIRFPLIFFNSNTWYWDEKKAKLTNFIELAILEFWCPKRTHNTKSTKKGNLPNHPPNTPPPFSPLATPKWKCRPVGSN